ncbi:MAG: tetratricopeptide repeat protein, partial [Pseudomonadota bacterium]
MKTIKPREIRIFISFVFRDMFNEREILTQQVFPKIRRCCFERGIGFTEIDLHWGTEQFNPSLVVPLCFQQIDNCQPFFIGLLGEDYGSTIPPEQIETICRDYPWIKQGCLERSNTELEITYALFERSAEQRQALAENALFCFREPSFPQNRAKQQKLKQRLRDHGCQIADYKQPIDLKELVLESLRDKIDQKFPDTLTSQEREDFEHDALALSRQSVYIKRQTDFDRLSQHALSDEPPLIITGESGCGKTALLANWAKEYQQAHPNELVFWHFCGCSDPLNLLKRIMASLKSHFHLDEEIPTSAEKIKEQFRVWLGKAPKRVILIIDGLNQDTHDWLYSIPTKTRLILSTTSADNSRQDWQTLSLPLLTEISARQTLIIEYFKRYGKALSAEPMQYLLETPQTANPLYLRIILEELRTISNFNKLGDHLKAYLQAKTIPELYQKVLARLEEDYQPPGFEHLVENALSLLWAARRGLSGAEILAILKVPQAIWLPLYLALQNVLMSRAGLLYFCHDYLRQTVETMYLNTPEQKRAVHCQLAGYFEQQPADARIAYELPYQLEQAGEKQRLQACLSKIPLFLYFEKDELVSYWQRLGATEETLTTAYSKGLREYEQNISEEELAESLDKIAIFFWNIDYFSSAELFFRQALALREKVLPKEHPIIAYSMSSLANLLYSKGDYNGAELLYCQALDIFELKLGSQHPHTVIVRNNLESLFKEKVKVLLTNSQLLYGEEAELLKASALMNQADVLYDKGDYNNAEPLYHQALTLREKILPKEHPDIAYSMSGLANLLYSKGDYDSAEPLFRQALALFRK